MSDDRYLQSALYQIQETPTYTAPTRKAEEPEFIERQVKSVPMPAAFVPTDDQLFMNDAHGRRRPNPDFLREHFLREGRLTIEQALTILRQTTDLLASEPNILHVRSPVTGASLVAHCIARSYFDVCFSGG